MKKFTTQSCLKSIAERAVSFFSRLAWLQLHTCLMQESTANVHPSQSIWVSHITLNS